VARIIAKMVFDSRFCLSWENVAII
jgi:hypothetical protein